MGSRAAVHDFRTLVDHPWWAGAIVYPITHLQLARASAKTGDSAGADAAYERFLQMWASADAEALVAQARRERAELTSH